MNDHAWSTYFSRFASSQIYTFVPVSKGKPIELIYLITHPILWLWLLYEGKRGFKI